MESKTMRRGLAFLAAGSLVAGVTPFAVAWGTNPDTMPGNMTQNCDVSWVAKSDLSTGLTKDRDENGTIENGEVYSNQGFLQEVSSQNKFDKVVGPGDFLLHHWANNNTSLGFRLPFATDYAMYDVNVVIKGYEGDFTLNQDLTALGLTKYVAIDGNSKYTKEMTAPKVTYDTDGSIKLHWEYIPAGSANIFNFSGVATDGKAQDPASSYKIQATLDAQYAEGAGCQASVPAVPTPPKGDACDQILTGRTTFPLNSTDVTSRTKEGEGGEVNADGWNTGNNKTLRLYGATDKDITNVVYTVTASQGFTFDAKTVGTVITGSPTGMGALYANGYTKKVEGLGTVTVSPDGKTLTLKIDKMPAKSAFAFNITAVPDGSMKQLVIDSVMTADYPGCTLPTPSPSATPDKTTTPKPDKTKTPKPDKTKTPKPDKTATPKPDKTKTPKPVDQNAKV